MTLPEGWRGLSLAEIAEGGVFSDGDWVESRDQDPSGAVRLTQLADVGVGEWRNRSDRWLREDQAARLGCTFLQPRDVLIARMPDPLGRACLVPERIGRAVTVVDVALLRIARPDVDPAFVMWAMNAPAARAKVESMQSGTTRKRISRKNLATVRLPIPSLDEQRRIVEVLEEHLSRLDSAVGTLRAIEGRLNGLLEVFLVRRPKTVSRSLGEVAEIQGGIQKQPQRLPRLNAHPFLRVANVTAYGLSLVDVHQIELFGNELARYRLRKGDLLVVEGNGSASQIGRAAIWDGSIDDCVHQNHLIRVRPTSSVNAQFLEIMWNSSALRRQLTELASSSSGLHTLSVSKLRALQIPVPDMPAQLEIVQEVEGLRGIVSKLTREADRVALRSAALRRALLQAAFSGQLTGHPSDLDRAEGFVSA